MTDEWGRPLIIGTTSSSGSSSLYDRIVREPSISLGHTWTSTGTTSFSWPEPTIPWPLPGPVLSAEDYAVIEEVIIDSIARGYVQDRRDGIDRA